MNYESRPMDLAEIVTEVEIGAARDTVWQVLTRETARWWHPAYYSDPRGAQIGGFRIETELGGRMFEDWGGGQGLVWGVVVALDHGRTLQVVGDTSPAWGGPSRHWFRWKLEDAGSRTRLRFENAIWGRVSEATRASLEEGWRYLFEHGLKRWCETGTLDGAPPAPGSWARIERSRSNGGRTEPGTFRSPVRGIARPGPSCSTRAARSSRCRLRARRAAP